MTIIADGFAFLEAPRWHDGRLYFSDMDAVLGDEHVDLKYKTEIEPRKNRLRIRYVKELSFVLDTLILIETVFRLLGFTRLILLDIDP